MTQSSLTMAVALHTSKIIKNNFFFEKL